MTAATVARGARGYPHMLAAIHDPPARLHARGAALHLLAGPAVAIVGARTCSAYGAHVALELGRGLARAGVVVVSGLARGIDAEAHRGALDVGGPTVAVLGCGIDRDYPRSNAALAARIAGRGLIVSEYPPGTEPAPWRFPARNRIVAGLSLAVVVVEARERSGALITADLALGEGREVLAVPGEITSSLSRGPNLLIRQGATPCLGVADVLEAIGLDVPAAPRGPTVGPAAAAVMQALADEPAGADELVERTGIPADRVAAALVELELAGLVAHADGRYRGALA